jgi:hypothetical protein
MAGTRTRSIPNLWKASLCSTWDVEEEERKGDGGGEGRRGEADASHHVGGIKSG